MKFNNLVNYILEENEKNIGDFSNTIFVMKSPYTPKGWDYDHIGFVLKNGIMKDMSGHRYTKDGKEPMPPVKYKFEDIEKLFNMPKSKIEAKNHKLYDEINLPFMINVPDKIVCDIKDKNKKAVNCGSFVKIILSNNGIQTTESDRPDEIFYSISETYID